MASRQLVLGIGAVGVGGAAYYLYTAGGSPKVAEKKFEHDAAKLQARLRGDASSKGTEVQKGIEASAQQVGSSVDYAIEQAKAEGKYYQGQVQSFGKDVERKANEAVEQAKAQAKDFQSQLSHFGRDAEKKFEEAFDKAKAQGQEYTKDIQSYQTEAEKKLEEAKKETGNRLTKAVDEFDRVVEQGASKAKTSIFSWFGNGKSS